MSRAWNSTLNAATKPIARQTPLRNRGGTSFKLTPEDIAQWEWMGEQRPQPCDACGYRTYSRCHIVARSHGGLVVNNIVWLCEHHDVPGVGLVRGCHTRQEKRHLTFMAELEAEGNPVNLFAIAAAHTAQWRKEAA